MSSCLPPSTINEAPIHFHETSPGETPKDERGARQLSAAALALKLRVPPQRLHDIIRGQGAITPDTALRLARFFGNSAEFWLSCKPATIWR